MAAIVIGSMLSARGQWLSGVALSWRSYMAAAAEKLTRLYHWLASVAIVGGIGGS